MSNAIELVRDRLAMVQRLIEHNERVAREEKSRSVGVQGWTHPVGQHQALVNYLLLTCFDVLGQPREWLHFGAWLEAKRTANERSAVATDSDPVGWARNAYKAYCNAYGVRRAFDRFVLEDLSEEARQELFATIEIHDYSGWDGTGPRRFESNRSDAAKLAFLFETRNLFTHSAVAEGSPARYVTHPFVELDSRGYTLKGEHLRTDGAIEYWTAGWPFSLYKIVADFIGDPLPDFDVSFEVVLSDARDRWGIVEAVPWRAVRDPRFARVCGFDHGAVLLGARYPRSDQVSHVSKCSTDEEEWAWLIQAACFIEQLPPPPAKVIPNVLESDQTALRRTVRERLGRARTQRDEQSHGNRSKPDPFKRALRWASKHGREFRRAASAALSEAVAGRRSGARRGSRRP